MLTRRSAPLAGAALPFAAQAQQTSALRIAMTLADIPVTDGAPDQGTEGIRFMGYTMYDPLVAWDLSSATVPAKLVPGLATKWSQDSADPTKWIFELRQGVKFQHNAFMRFVDSQQVPPKGSNWGYIQQPEFDELAKQARATSDPKELDKVLARINTRMVDEAVFVWVVHDVWPNAISSKVRAISIPRAGTSTSRQ